MLFSGKTSTGGDMLASNQASTFEKAPFTLTFGEGDQIEILDKPVRPKGLRIEITHSGTTEPVDRFIPAESWDQVRPNSYPIHHVLYDMKFQYESGRFVHISN
jgi:hypothetical protein